MFHYTIEPRFSDTDALGHISNTAFPIWFEQARPPIFKIFHPSLDVKSWPLIIARFEVDLTAQTYWGKPVEIRTFVGKIGNSSCQVVQQAWQGDVKVEKGTATLIYFNYKTQKSVAIPQDIRQQLEKHLQE